MSTVISKDGTKIAFDKLGQGPAVILVGGAFNSRTFGPNESLAPLLAQQFTVYNYDRRGRGESTDTQPYAIEREIEDLDALITEAGGTAYVYGISSGAALALEAANRLNTRITKLALFELPMVVDDSRAPFPSDFAGHLRNLIADDKRNAAIHYFMTKGVSMPAFFVYMMRLMPAWKQLKGVAHTVPYDAALVNDFGTGRPLPKTRWTSVNMPTLVVDGEKSPAWMRHSMVALAEALPCGSHTTLPGQMHIVSADSIGPVLVEFFKK